MVVSATSSFRTSGVLVTTIPFCRPKRRRCDRSRPRRTGRSSALGKRDIIAASRRKRGRRRRRSPGCEGDLGQRLLPVRRLPQFVKLADRLDARDRLGGMG